MLNSYFFCLQFGSTSCFVKASLCSLAVQVNIVQGCQSEPCLGPRLYVYSLGDYLCKYQYYERYVRKIQMTTSIF